MLYLHGIVPLLPMSGVAIGSAFNVMLLEQFVASILYGNLTVVPRV